MRIPKGYSQLVTLGDSKSLGQGSLGSIPDGSNFAVIQPEGGDVRWRDDGTDPTAAVGMFLANGASLEYDGELDAIRLIQAAAGVKLNVSFYRCG